MTPIDQAHLERYKQGELELKDLVGITPDYLDQLKGRAQFFLDGKHHERALIMLDMLEELDRQDPLPTLLAVGVLLELGRSDAAGEKIAQLRERFGDHPDVLLAQAELLLKGGQLVPAAAVLEKVMSADPQGKTATGRRALAMAARGHALFERS